MIEDMLVIAYLVAIFIGLYASRWAYNKIWPLCARCKRRKFGPKMLKFRGVRMCEPCENIANYYWSQQGRG